MAMFGIMIEAQRCGKADNDERDLFSSCVDQPPLTNGDGRKPST
jgi:hypothetical protein